MFEGSAAIQCSRKLSLLALPGLADRACRRLLPLLPSAFPPHEEDQQSAPVDDAAPVGGRAHRHPGPRILNTGSEHLVQTI